MKTFYHILANVLIATVTNNFIWFALVFWIYLETHSVLATSIVGGIYLIVTALSGFWFGSIVDHNKKKTAMLLSSIVTLIIFGCGLLLYSTTPPEMFKSVENVTLWVFAVTLLMGVIVGNIRNIALPTLVTILVPEENRDKANGLSGSVMGVAFSITSFASGIVLAYGGMTMVLIAALVLTALTILQLAFIEIPEKEIVYTKEAPKRIDVKGTIKVIAAVPGLFALILFNTFNNFLGGVYMSLMDAYGLTLVSVQVWGILWGFLSMGIILGGLIVAKRGLGKHPLRVLFMTNIVLWTVSIIFPLQPWIILMAVCMFAYMLLIPFVEAAEQTILQKVVPLERQGRVFGFAQSVEQSASPLSAFLIGPIAQFVFIPFMTTGAGVDLIGGWFGVGQGRGLALVFIITGFIGITLTLWAMRTKSYAQLTQRYENS
jgi:DHA3 family multidrug efflux protein-like MFS transporter